MAPEICLGKGKHVEFQDCIPNEIVVEYDYKVDVFSYGVVLIEIITQAVPEERKAQFKFALNEQVCEESAIDKRSHIATAVIQSESTPRMSCRVCTACSRLLQIRSENKANF